MSKDNQHALGMETAAQVFQQMPVLPDYSAESQYIRQLGKKLVATIPESIRGRSSSTSFRTSRSTPSRCRRTDVHQCGDAHAARNEAELAGVMGHEMAHVYMQHSAKQAGKAQTTSMIAGIASAVLGGTVGSKAGGLVGQLGQMGIQMGAQGLLMKYSRSDESQADAVGAVILHKAGYNPQSMVDFFKTMGAQAARRLPNFQLSSESGQSAGGDHEANRDWPRELCRGRAPASTQPTSAPASEDLLATGDPGRSEVRPMGHPQ
jgi:predicted Zn-dependent protease